jgi:hypothetical protein
MPPGDSVQAFYLKPMPGLIGALSPIATLFK